MGQPAPCSADDQDRDRLRHQPHRQRTRGRHIGRQYSKNSARPRRCRPGVDPVMSNPDVALVNHFESLGRGCEFGFLQRRAGAEPMGLLRFASMPLEGLIHGLQTQFAGIGDADGFALSRNDGEYWIEVSKFALRYHTELYEGEITPEELVQLERRKVKFLAAGLIEGLKSGSKIFVYLRRQPVTDREFDELRAALASNGSATLLWVTASDGTHSADSVELLDGGLMVGYLGRLAPRQALYDVDYA